MTDRVLVNDVTGDRLVTRNKSKLYEQNYENTFGKKEEKVDTRPIVSYSRIDGVYYFEGESNGFDYLSALDKYPKTEFVWKAIK